MSEPSPHNGSDWRAGHSDLSVMHVQDGFIILSLFFKFREHRAHTSATDTMNELCYCSACTRFKTALLLIVGQKILSICRAGLSPLSPTIPSAFRKC